MTLDLLKKLNIPKTPGCYKYFDKSGKIIYIGKASDLRSRIFSYWRKGTSHTPAKEVMIKRIVKIEWVETDSEIEALLLESNLVKKHQPEFNIDLRDDKRFSYIKISTEDEIPGVFITRKIDKSGKYFGPFTSSQAIRETVKIIRKIWPYCTERKIKKRACFYSQIGRCTGVCAGEFSIKEYKEKIIKPIILFLSGKKKQVINKYKSRIKNYEKLLKSIPHEKALSADSIKSADHKIYQTPNVIKDISLRGKIFKIEDRGELKYELGLIKQRLLNIQYVLEHAKVISLGEKYAADVIELAKVLNLPKIPERIEGYDISNIYGREAVGSMVVFSGGEPNKKEYRKFKIKFTNSSFAGVTEGKDLISDVWMLKEVLERRMKHFSVSEFSEKEEKNFWPDPDLIVIDGGKGQLNVAVRIMKKNKKDIPIISISKGNGLRSAQAPDKIFFPGERNPLELPLASPALHIIKRVRDEAHRFAIKYHRELRSRKFKK
jgi:excinuclease ABC subunit C